MQSQRNWSEWKRMILGRPPGRPGYGAAVVALRDSDPLMAGTAARTEASMKSLRVPPWPESTRGIGEAAGLKSVWFFTVFIISSSLNVSYLLKLRCV
jgi:hypothetical protein